MSIIFFHYLTIVTALVNLGLAGYLFFRTPRSRQKRIVGFILLQLGVWAGLIFFMESAFVDANAILWLVRLSLVSVLFVPATFLLFALQFSMRRNALLERILFIPPLLMLPFGFTNFNAYGFRNGVIEPEAVLTGSLFSIFLPYVATYCLVASILFFRQSISSESSIARSRTKIILAGFLCAWIIAFIDNGILPHFFGLDSKESYGVAGSLLFSLALVYAMTRYRFFGTRFLITRGLVYGSIAATVLITTAITISFLSSKAEVEPTVKYFSFLTGLGLVAIGLFSAHAFFKQRIARLVPVEGFDFSLLEEAPELIDTNQYYSRLVLDMQKSLANSLPEIQVGLFVFLRPAERWLPVDNDRWPRLLSDHPVAKIVLQLQAPLIKSDLQELEWLTEKNVTKAEAKEAAKLLDKLGVDAVWPLWWWEKEIRGLLTLELPLSSKTLTLEQIAVIEPLADRFGQWLSQVIAYHYAVRRGERAVAGLSMNRE